MFDGMSAEEYHSQNAFPPNAKCAGCQRRGGLITRVIMLAPLDEVLKRDPELAAVFHAANIDFRNGDSRLTEKLRERLVATKYGDHMRISTTYACKACTPSLEKEAAKAPSWMICDINYGPGSDKVTVQNRLSR